MLEALALILFLSIFLLILFGFPVAFTLGGVSVLFGLAVFGPDFFYLLALRVYGTMNNYVLLAVPLFIYMGIMLEKSGLAESLLETMALLFGKLRGGLAISVVVVGAMLAASTGIVGATVITMGLISLPTMLKRGYSAELATGTIASAGTLGQIIPPSVVLVLLGSVLNVSVGDLFTAALIPGLALVGAYLLYIVGVAVMTPHRAPGHACRRGGRLPAGRHHEAGDRGVRFALFADCRRAGLDLRGNCFAHRSGRRGRAGGRAAHHLPGQVHADRAQRRDARDDAPHLHGVYHPGGSHCLCAGVSRTGG